MIPCVPESETVALDLTCAECGRSPRAGEVWRIYFADRIAREAVTYCPQCAEREFGEGEDGRTIMETIGAERDGVTEKQAQAELRERLVRVERKGYRRPRKLTFRTYAETWFTEGQTRRRWKASTVKEYRSVRRRLVERFGPMPLEAVRPRHVAEYVADLSTQYGAATVSRDVSILHAIFATAKREELVEANPAERAERPKLPQRRWRILEPSEVASVAQAFTDEQARVVFLTLVLTGVRRSELQALRWSDVDLLEGVLRVRDSKTEEGVRSIALPSRLQGELAEHYRRSVFKGADELVFCHHERGTVYSRALQGGSGTRSRGRRRRGTCPAVPRPQALGDHARRGFRLERDRGHGEGWTPQHGDDEDLPAPGRRRLPRRGRAARSSASRTR
jgi:integrase